MILAYKLTESQEKGLTVSVFLNGRSYTYTPENHTAFYELLDSLRDYATALREDPQNAEVAAEKVTTFLKPEYLVKVAESTEGKLELKDGTLYFKGEPLVNVLADKVMRFHEKKLPYQYLWNFLENLMNNPDVRSREQLYAFLERYDFPITPDGHFLAYKGLRADGTSVNAGYGIVDGEVFEHAHLPNPVGSVVTMPRHKVNADPSVGCSYGLHVGTLDYVRGFASGNMVIVKVNPRDVVSVPEDCSYKKVRTCKYEVVGKFEDEIKEDVVETTPSTNLESLVKAMADEGVTNEYHLANRAVNRLHPEATGLERKNYFDELLPVAKKVLGVTDEEDDTSELPSDIPQEYINLILNNVDSIFPVDNVYHCTARILNLELGRGAWKKDDKIYSQVLEYAKNMYDEMDLYPEDEADAVDFTRKFRR